jgi:hypothetical protein
MANGVHRCSIVAFCDLFVQRLFSENAHYEDQAFQRRALEVQWEPTSSCTTRAA